MSSAMGPEPSPSNPYDREAYPATHCDIQSYSEFVCRRTYAMEQRQRPQKDCQEESSAEQTVGNIIIAADIREPHLSAFEQERQPFVVQPEKFQDRRMQVIYVNAILGGAEPELIGGADCSSAFDPATGEPRREPIRIVIAAGAFVRVTPVGDRRSPEFTAPYHECALQQTARL